MLMVILSWAKIHAQPDHPFHSLPHSSTYLAEIYPLLLHYFSSIVSSGIPVYDSTSFHLDWIVLQQRWNYLKCSTILVDS